MNIMRLQRPLKHVQSLSRNADGRLFHSVDSSERHLAPLWRFSAIKAPDINVIAYLLTYLYIKRRNKYGQLLLQE